MRQIGAGLFAGTDEVIHGVFGLKEREHLKQWTTCLEVAGLGPPGFPDHRRRVVTTELLLSHETVEKVLHSVQLIAADRSFSLRNSAHDKMRSRLTVLE